MHYFDYAATTPLSPGAEKAMVSALATAWCNPSGQYPPSVTVAKTLSSHRLTLANALGCSAEEFFFTSGGTESNNWGIFQGVHSQRHQGKHIITTAVEHSSVMNPMKALGQQGYDITYVSPNKEGQITPEMLLSHLREDTIFLSVMMVNNETGVIFPVAELAQAVKAQKKDVLFHSDGIQGFLKLPFSLAEMGAVDLLSISGHKIFAPKGIGGLFVRKGVKLPPLLLGGGQEQGQRSGTEALHQIAAFAAAVQSPTDFDQLCQRKEEIRQKLEEIPQVKLLLPEDCHTAPHILPFSLVGYPSQVVLRYLAEKEIYLSAGSACHRGKESHVFSLLPLSKKEKLGALRLSISKETTEDDISALIEGLKSAVSDLMPVC